VRKAAIALCYAAAFLQLAVVSCAQTPSTQRPISFEVVSVKPVVRIPGSGPATRREDDGRYEYRPVNMLYLLLRAYGLEVYQVSGPAWIREIFYDVVATIPKGATSRDIPAMLRQLLADRFHLVVRRELGASPVYVITVAQGGPKLQACEMKAQERPQSIEERIGPLHALEAGDCPANRVFTRGEATMLVEAHTVAFLARALHDGSDRPVLDRTGLDGHCRIQLECAQAMGASEDTSGFPSMSTALQSSA
jgi:uncharacterized protein (TIGR03435 family)